MTQPFLKILEVLFIETLCLKKLEKEREIETIREEQDRYRNRRKKKIIRIDINEKIDIKKEIHLGRKKDRKKERE